MTIKEAHGHTDAKLKEQTVLQMCWHASRVPQAITTELAWQRYRSNPQLVLMTSTITPVPAMFFGSQPTTGWSKVYSVWSSIQLSCGDKTSDPEIAMQG